MAIHIIPQRVNLNRVILFCGRVGPPVRYLNYVRDHYEINTDQNPPDTTDVPQGWCNRIRFSRQTAQRLATIGRAMTREMVNNSHDAIHDEAQGVATVYHEAVHAYFDLREDANDRGINSLIREGLIYYQHAPLSGGGRLERSPGWSGGLGRAWDALQVRRLFNEAGAEYVDNRILVWWHAFRTLSWIRLGHLQPDGASRSVPFMV